MKQKAGKRMKPRRSENENPQGDLFKIELIGLVDPRHPLVRLAAQIDWTFFEREFDPLFTGDRGQPPKPTRLMVGLEYLKQTYSLSDEELVERWRENLYWQHFCGMKWLTYDPPIDPSSMTRWRKRLSQSGAEAMLAETIRAGLQTGTIRPSSFAKVNVDTTVQEKAVAHPTDSRLYDRIREKLVRLAEARGLKLRQSDRRVSQKILSRIGRYAHARQMKRVARETRKLKTILGRVVRDAMHKIGENRTLEACFHEPLMQTVRLLH